MSRDQSRSVERPRLGASVAERRQTRRAPDVKAPSPVAGVSLARVPRPPIERPYAPFLPTGTGMPATFRLTM